MPNPENGFDKFLDDLDNQKALEADLKACTERFTGFLEERGIDTELPEVKIKTFSLATHKMMLEKVMVLNPDNPEHYSFKKKLQAQSLLQDEDLAWQELIDQEFPGEPLDKNDIDTIASEFSARLQRSENNTIQYQQTKSAMVEHLTAEYQTDLSEIFVDDDNEEILDYLAFIHSIYSVSKKPQDGFEFARSKLLSLGYLDDPAWRSLLERFFPTQEG